MTDALLAELAARGGSSRTSDVDAEGRSLYEAVADRMGLSAEERTELDGDGRLLYEHDIRGAKDRLKKKGLVSSSAHAPWSLTLNYFESAALGTLRKNKARVEISAELFDVLQRKRSTTGRAGELFVLQHERDRLKRAGRHDLAADVHHLAVSDVYAGYDVRSFETDGTVRRIEVKSAEGPVRTFEISANEIRKAREHGSSYYIALVSNVHSDEPSVAFVRDPAARIDVTKVWEPEPRTFNIKV